MATDPIPPPAKIQQNDRVVFLVGAGASVHLGLPLMADFINVASDKYFARRIHNPSEFLTDRYEKLVNFHHACSQSAVAFNRDWNNLEELYTQADLLRLSSLPTKDEAENLCKSIAWAIWDVYRIPTVPTSDRKLWPDAVRQIEAAGLRTTIITTNYDLGVEIPLHADGRPFHYPGFDIWQAGKPLLYQATPPRYDPSSVPIIKLHGSVNWFTHTRTGKWFAIAPSHVPQDVTNQDFHAPNFSDRLKQAHIDGATLDEVEPAIVPPMLGKGLFTEVLAAHWREAILALRSARTAIVIGYSFPPTDTFMSRLLSEGLKGNSQIRQFFVVDKGPAEAWKPRLASMMTHDFSQTRLRLKAETKARDFLNVLGSRPVKEWHTL